MLRGEEVKKFGITKSYLLRNNVEISFRRVIEELRSYAEMAGLEMKIEDKHDLGYVKEVARRIMSKVERKRDLEPEVLGEILPNLNRILNLTHNADTTYILHIDPQDLESQMEALQSVTSCMSPGGSRFSYTQEYMENPYTWWVVIKDGKNVVGRVTIFVGKDYKRPGILGRVWGILNRMMGRTFCIARVSKVHSHALVEEESIDEALRKYARDCGYSFLESGTMVVPGLKKVYDDFVIPGEVVVRR